MVAVPEESWLVYVSDADRVSRCVPASQPIGQPLETEGLRLVWNKAPSRFEGWTFAAIELGYLPDDYDDRMLPCAFWSPTVLYRAVSLREMAHILHSGSVRGGGNGFNGFDRRPFVFFSPSPSFRCIAQGDEVDRAAAQAVMEDHGAQAFAGKDGDARFKQLYLKARADLLASRDGAEFTSAVLRTRPISPGLHYSLEHGRTGMGEEDEYGLFPRQVVLSDIEEVLLVRDCEVVRSCALDEAAAALGPAIGVCATAKP